MENTISVKEMDFSFIKGVKLKGKHTIEIEGYVRPADTMPDAYFVCDKGNFIYLVNVGSAIAVYVNGKRIDGIKSIKTTEFRRQGRVRMRITFRKQYRYV